MSARSIKTGRGTSVTPTLDRTPLDVADDKANPSALDTAATDAATTTAATRAAAAAAAPVPAVAEMAAVAAAAAADAEPQPSQPPPPPPPPPLASQSEVVSKKVEKWQPQLELGVYDHSKRTCKQWGKLASETSMSFDHNPNVFLFCFQ